MFSDSVTIDVKSGHGGPGSRAFHREKFIIEGGPSGGDGGDGGSIFVLVDRNSDNLTPFRKKKLYKADDGEGGKNKMQHGKKGEDLILSVPPGTQIFDDETGECLFDLTEDGQKILLLKGGKGGLGNIHFKSSTNQKPQYAQPGLPGLSKRVRLELKLIADVGLVGFPNVGKSTLISVLSAARPEIANYEFTTLTPKLGVVEVGVYESFVMADIPGIIEGASVGKGLGLRFLRHIERTKTLLFMLDPFREQTPTEQYTILRHELLAYSHELSTRPFGLALTKCDTLDTDEQEKFLTEITTLFESLDLKPRFILPISSATHSNMEALKYALYELIGKK